jgi:L-amino acid N-acyltransferase YncA
MIVREYRDADVADMVRIWNKVVEDGVAFPQEDYLDMESGKEFFAAQSHCGVVEEDGAVKGMYILHPNNIGRCGHIANASYAVDADSRGLHIGEQLVKDCLAQAKRLGFRLLQFNAVVEGNIHARHLYERLGFTQIGTVPGGFRLKDGTYSDICLYYHEV